MAQQMEQELVDPGRTTPHRLRIVVAADALLTSLG
jgi:hypothetical protein